MGLANPNSGIPTFESSDSDYLMVVSSPYMTLISRVYQSFRAPRDGFEGAVDRFPVVVVISIDINTANIKEHERVMIFIFFLFHILLSLSFIVF